MAGQARPLRVERVRLPDCISFRATPTPTHRSFTIPRYGESDARRVLPPSVCVASGGVSVAYRVDFSAHAAPRDAWRRRPRRFRAARAGRGIRPKACSTSCSAAPEAASPPGAAANQFLADPFGLTSSRAAAAPPRFVAPGRRFASAAATASTFRSRARQRLAGSDVPGVLPGERHQGLLRQHHRWRSSANGERYADSENAFAFRKALRADCTCNGQFPRSGSDRPFARHLAAAG